MSAITELAAAPTGTADGGPARVTVLDEYAKREIRRAVLTAVAVPGYQVPFGSREMPVASRTVTVSALSRATKPV